MYTACSFDQAWHVLNSFDMYIICGQHLNTPLNSTGVRWLEGNNKWVCLHIVWSAVPPPRWDCKLCTCRWCTCFQTVSKEIVRETQCCCGCISVRWWTHSAGEPWWQHRLLYTLGLVGSGVLPSQAKSKTESYIKLHTAMSLTRSGKYGQR